MPWYRVLEGIGVRLVCPVRTGYSSSYSLREVFVLFVRHEEHETFGGWFLYMVYGWRPCLQKVLGDNFHYFSALSITQEGNPSVGGEVKYSTCFFKKGRHGCITLRTTAVGQKNVLPSHLGYPRGSHRVTNLWNSETRVSRLGYPESIVG